jgi:hypothetical protein
VEHLLDLSCVHSCIYVPQLFAESEAWATDPQHHHLASIAVLCRRRFWCVGCGNAANAVHVIVEERAPNRRIYRNTLGICYVGYC